MRTRIALVVVALGAFLFGAPGCGGGGSTNYSSSVSISNDPMALESRGVKVQIEGVTYSSTSVTTNTSTTQSATVGGHEFHFDGATLRIGDREYGSLIEGDDVRITPDGVTVNGESRGSLPE